MTTRNPGDKRPRRRSPGPSAKIIADAPIGSTTPAVVEPQAKRGISAGQKKLTMIAGVGVVLVLFLVGVFAFVGTEAAVAVEIPAPTPGPTLEVLPTIPATPFIVIATPSPQPPRPLNEIVPRNQRGYLSYRFYHAWEELSHCRMQYEAVQLEKLETRLAIAAAAPLEEIDPESVESTPTPTPAPTKIVPDDMLEQTTLLNLQAETRWLLERYNTSECVEPVQFIGMAGRTKWLMWAAGYSTGIAETD